MPEITNDWLETLAFYQLKHLPQGVLELRTGGHELRTWVGSIVVSRRWTLNGLDVHPRPETQADVKALLRRIRR